MTKLSVVIAIALALLACFGTIEAPVALIFGWISFLVSVLPRMTVEWPSLAVAAIALVLFAGGVHLAGRAWRRHHAADESNPAAGTPWKVRWSLAVITTVFLLFTAGIALVGTTHQIVWLFSSERPMFVPGRPFGLGTDSQSANNMKMMAIGFQSAHDIYKEIPVGTFAHDGKMLHGWETRILIGVNYYVPREADLTRPWNDPVNQKYFKCIIPEFINPGFATPELVNADGYGLNHYSANVHVLGPEREVKKFTDFRDGTSNTLLLGEISAHFRPWAQPGNWRDPAIGISRYPGGFGGPDGSGAYFAMADGSVRFISDRVSPETLRALSTPSGGETIDQRDWSR